MPYTQGVSATPSIKVVKSSPYKGGTRVWSNRYHFLGGTPADAGHWTTLANAILTAEKACTMTTTTLEECIGYDAGSDVPIFTGGTSVAGTYTFGGSAVRSPLEVCALVRFTTDQRTTKNHPIYLFNYMHCVAIDPAINTEALATSQQTAFNTYFSNWLSGFSDGTNTYTRAGPNGAAALTRLVESEVTHRDFPR